MELTDAGGLDLTLAVIELYRLLKIVSPKTARLLIIGIDFTIPVNVAEYLQDQENGFHLNIQCEQYQ